MGHLQIWNRIRELSSTNTLPRGMVLSMTVHDPRLRCVSHGITADTNLIDECLSFPPLIRGPTHAAQSALALFTPSPSLASSSLWEESVRGDLRVKKYSSAELNLRRSQVRLAGLDHFCRIVP